MTPGGSPRERALRRMLREYGIQDDDPRRAEAEKAIEGTAAFAFLALGEAMKDVGKALDEALEPLWRLLRSRS